MLYRNLEDVSIQETRGNKADINVRAMAPDRTPEPHIVLAGACPQQHGRTDDQIVILVLSVPTSFLIHGFRLRNLLIFHIIIPEKSEEAVCTGDDPQYPGATLP